MPHRTATADRVNLQHLLGDLVRDGRRLLEQQIDLFRAEAGPALRGTGDALASLSAGGGLAAAGGVLSGLMLAHLLQRASGLPLWACYGLTGAGLLAAGGRLVRAGQARLTTIPALPQSTEALGENLAWLSNQVSAESR
jgi:Putative Actinobacterial Holin-X, holin superfamily III